MGSEILERLSIALPKDKTVLVIGHGNIQRDNLGSLIDNLNRDDEWIRPEFRATTAGVKVTSRTGVVLTMIGLNPGTLARIRAEAEAEKVCCPHQILTVNEVKEILNALHHIRNGINGSQNGNHLRGEYHVENPPMPVDQRVADDKKINSSQPANDSDDVGSALSALEKFKSVVEETEIAVMVVADQLKATIAKNVALGEELKEKNRAIAKLNEKLTDLDRIARERANLEDENKSLKDTLAQLQKDLGDLGSMIRRVQGK